MKKDPKIRKLYKDFIESLTQLMEEGNDYFDKNLKLLKRGNYRDEVGVLQTQINDYVAYKGGMESLTYDEFDSLKGDLKRRDDLMEESKSLGRGIGLQLNSNFIYSFALFETFQSEVIKVSCKKNSTPRKRFQSKFLAEAKKALSETGNSEYIDMIMNHDKTLENSHITGNPMKLCRDLFDINRIEKFEKYWMQYLEARERRNLLVHRGINYDKMYEQSFLEGGVKDKKNKTAKKWLEEHISRYGRGSEEGVINLSVTPAYIFNIYSTLFYMASLTYFSSFKLTKKEIKDNHEIFPDSQHTYMKVMHKYPSISLVLLDVWLAYLDNKADKKWENIPDFEKMNFLLVLSFLNDRYKEDDGGIKDFNKTTKMVLSTVSNSHSKHKELVQNYIDGDVNKLIETSKKLNLTSDLGEWFIFDKFKTDDTFQKFIGTFKDS